MAVEFLKDYGEFVGRSGARMLEGWAGVVAESLLNPGDAFAGINPFASDDARYQAANRILEGAKERTEKAGHWLSGEYSQGALDIGTSLQDAAGDVIEDSPLAQALVGTLEDPSLQLGLELLPGVGGVLGKASRVARRASPAEAIEQAFLKRNPDYLHQADPMLPPGQKPLGQQMGGKQAGIIAGEQAIANLRRSGDSVMTSHGRKSGDQLAEDMGRAQNMLNEGADADDIWWATGMNLGVDDAWKFEIDDRTSQFVPGDARTEVTFGANEKYYQGKLPDFLQHEDLYKAYPKMEDLEAELAFEPGGAYYPNMYGDDGSATQIEWINVDKNSRDPRSLLLHEAQHAVQAREPGFDTGSNPTAAPALYDEDLPGQLDDWMETLHESGVDNIPHGFLSSQNMPVDGDELEMVIHDQASWVNSHLDDTSMAYEYEMIEDHFGPEPLNLRVESGYDSYMRSAGENEARTVQMRADANPAWRLAHPLDEDAPVNREDRWLSDESERGVTAWSPERAQTMWDTEIDRESYPGQEQDEVYSIVSHPETGEQVGQMSAFKRDDGTYQMDETAEIYDEYQRQGAGTAALASLVDDVGTLHRSQSEAPGMVALMDVLAKKGYQLTDDTISTPPSVTTPTGYQKPAVPGEAIRLGPRNRKAVPETLKKEFTNRDDDFWGVTFDDDGISQFESGYSGIQCTGFACAVKHKLEPGRAKVMGYMEGDNPKAGSNDLADGHDFALVDDRYIVDPWLSEVENGKITTHDGKKIDTGGQIVFDLKKDGDLIDKIYGDQEAWKEVKTPDRPFFDESLYRAMSKPDPAYSQSRKSDAPLPERAKSYPQTLWPESAWDKDKGKFYASKAESQEAKDLLKARAKAQRDMDKNGYTPYFDITKRYNVDPSNYTRRGDTQVEERYVDPKAEATHAAAIKTPEARARLEEAYTEAEGYSGAHDWYGMGQLEEEFIKHLGAKEGRKAFRDKFSDAMATTTGGSSPKDNFTNAMYGNYLSARGLSPPEAAFDMPSPIGGRYISGNMKLYDQVANKGGTLDATRPKRHNFSGNYEGFMDRSTVDEQMTELMTPGKQSPEGKTYGIYEAMIEEVAEGKGVPPANFQDVAWAGTKLKSEAKKAKSSYVPQPMIETVNEAIERTSRITGQSPEEVLVDGIIKSKTPVYAHPIATLGALAAAKALEESLTGDGVQ
jgi:hypothetical protein